MQIYEKKLNRAPVSGKKASRACFSCLGLVKDMESLRAKLLESFRQTTRVFPPKNLSLSAVGTRVLHLEESTRTTIFLCKCNQINDLMFRSLGGQEPRELQTILVARFLKWG